MPNSTDDTNDQTNSDCRKRRNSSPPERSFSPDLSTSSSPSNGALQQQFEQALNAGMNNIPLGDLSHIAFNYMLVVANALHEHYRRRESLREMMLLEHLRRAMAAEVQSVENSYNGGDNQFKAMQMCWPNFDPFYASGAQYPAAHSTSMGTDSPFHMTSFGNAHQLSALAQLNTSMSFPFSPPSLTPSPNSSSSRKKKPKPIPEEQKDEAYYARRHRNNESAKKSREMRRKKEEDKDKAMKFLEFENQRLKIEIEGLRQKIIHLQQVQYQAQVQLQATQIS
ncbi:hypothetical protein QR680_003400 [Steinernema hermaphroditum]|uniref:BZIP domain-containing protein n=1 Tax=Steinernema hermaphroditum TaxID=289476 RepID=A0AA39H7I2_9BILA|nr:hypothetical protein QR680_003400 [Steinernema hermaphroditum]